MVKLKMSTMIITIKDYANYFGVNRKTASRYYKQDCKLMGVPRMTAFLFTTLWAQQFDTHRKYQRVQMPQNVTNKKA